MQELIDRLISDKPLWLSAMIYRVIADPKHTEGITRGCLAFTFTEEPTERIMNIVDALINVGIVNDDGDVLSPVDYEDDDE
jgi:hypothetical protein